jgi:antitoxin HicB
MKATRTANPVAYPALLEPEPEGGFTITFPEAGIAASYGRTWEEALVQAEDLLEEAVLGFIAHEEEVPLPAPVSEGDLRPLIFLPPLTAAKLALFRALCEEGITKVELGRRMNVSPERVQRLFDGRHPALLKQIETALRALGRRLIITSEAA